MTDDLASNVVDFRDPHQEIWNLEAPLSLGDIPPELLNRISGLTERERRFAEAYFEACLEYGDGALLISYRRAFPLSQAEDKSAYHLARNLIKTPRVIALIDILRLKLATRAVVPAERIIREVERIALSNILDYVTIDADGTPVPSLGHASAAQTAAIKSVECIETVNSNTGNVTRRIKVLLYDKLDAIEKLMKVHHLYEKLLPEDIERLIRAAMMENEARGLPVSGSSSGSGPHTTLQAPVSE